MININNLYKAYNGNRYVLKDFNLKVSEGELIGIIGHNGAGKTTILKAITGIIKPSKGEIFVFGKNTLKEDLNIKRTVTYIPDKPIVFLELTGREYLEFIINIYGTPTKGIEEKIKEYSQRLKLYDYLNDKIKNYSQGMRKKIMIIGAFLSGAKIMILDEPLTGLDPEAIYIIKELLREYIKEKNSVLFSTHLLDVAEHMCSRFIIINDGNKKFDGSLEELKEKYGKEISLEEVFMEVIRSE